MNMIVNTSELVVTRQRPKQRKRRACEAWQNNFNMGKGGTKRQAGWPLAVSLAVTQMMMAAQMQCSSGAQAQLDAALAAQATRGGSGDAEAAQAAAKQQLNRKRLQIRFLHQGVSRLKVETEMTILQTRLQSWIARWGNRWSGNRYPSSDASNNAYSLPTSSNISGLRTLLSHKTGRNR